LILKLNIELVGLVGKVIDKKWNWLYNAFLLYQTVIIERRYNE